MLAIVLLVVMSRVGRSSCPVRLRGLFSFGSFGQVQLGLVNALEKGMMAMAFLFVSVSSIPLTHNTRQSALTLLFARPQQWRNGE